MKFLADEGVDKPVVDALREAGHQVWYIAEMEPGLSDEEVLTIASQIDALLVTADKDFGTLVFQMRWFTKGVILLRLAGLPPKAKAERVVWVIENYGSKMMRAFTVITPQAVRIRPLPQHPD